MGRTVLYLSIFHNPMNSQTWLTMSLISTMSFYVKLKKWKKGGMDLINDKFDASRYY